jgi:hypothetical protein
MYNVIILPEERGYIAGRARLYCWKSAVIFLEERGFIGGRARLYLCNKICGLPKIALLSHAHMVQ